MDAEYVAQLRLQLAELTKLIGELKPGDEHDENDEPTIRDLEAVYEAVMKVIARDFKEEN